MKFDKKSKTWTIKRQELLAFLDCTNENGKPIARVVVFERRTGMVWATDGVRALIFDPHGTARESIARENIEAMAIPRSVLHTLSLVDEVVIDPSGKKIALHRPTVSESVFLGSVPFVPADIKLPLMRELLILSARHKQSAKNALSQRNPIFNPALLSPLSRLDLSFELHVGDDVKETIELVHKPWIFVFMPMDINYVIASDGTARG